MLQCCTRSVASANQTCKSFISDLLWRPPEAAICNAAECCGLARRPRCCRLLRGHLWSDLHEFHLLTPSPPPPPIPKSFYHFTWAMQCSDMGSICHTPPPAPPPHPVAPTTLLASCEIADNRPNHINCHTHHCCQLYTDRNCRQIQHKFQPWGGKSTYTSSIILKFMTAFVRRTTIFCTRTW